MFTTICILIAIIVMLGVTCWFLFNKARGQNVKELESKIEKLGIEIQGVERQRDELEKELEELDIEIQRMIDEKDNNLDNVANKLKQSYRRH